MDHPLLSPRTFHTVPGALFFLLGMVIVMVEASSTASMRMFLSRNSYRDHRPDVLDNFCSQMHMDIFSTF